MVCAFESNRDNPRPLDLVRVQRLCPLKMKRPSATSIMDVVPTTSMIGGSSEPILEVITHDLALSVSRNLGTEVQVPGVAGRGGGGGEGGFGSNGV